MQKKLKQFRFQLELLLENANKEYLSFSKSDITQCSRFMWFGKIRAYEEVIARFERGFENEEIHS